MLNSLSLEVVKKPIASVAPYQIVLPKQPIVAVVQSERMIEKLNVLKSKPIQAVQNKTEKEPITIRSSVVSKKSISDDDGLLTEYKFMKKKNKTEKKSSLPSSTPPAVSLTVPAVVPLVLPSVVIKPKVQTVERFNSPEVIKPKDQNVEKFNRPVSNVQTVERFNLPEAIKSKVRTEEICNSLEVIKPKVQTVDKCNLQELKQNTDDVVLAITEKEKKEMCLLNKSQADQHPDIEKKITVLKRGLDEKHVNLLPATINKHGNIIFKYLD